MQLKTCLDLTLTEYACSLSLITLVVTFQQNLESRPQLETLAIFPLVNTVELRVRVPKCGGLELPALTKEVKILEVIGLCRLLRIASEFFKLRPCYVIDM